MRIVPNCQFRSPRFNAAFSVALTIGLWLGSAVSGWSEYNNGTISIWSVNLPSGPNSCSGPATVNISTTCDSSDDCIEVLDANGDMVQAQYYGANATSLLWVASWPFSYMNVPGVNCIYATSFYFEDMGWTYESDSVYFNNDPGSGTCEITGEQICCSGGAGGAAVMPISFRFYCLPPRQPANTYSWNEAYPWSPTFHNPTWTPATCSYIGFNETIGPVPLTELTTGCYGFVSSAPVGDCASPNRVGDASWWTGPYIQPAPPAPAGNCVLDQLHCTFLTDAAQTQLGIWYEDRTMTFTANNVTLAVRTETAAESRLYDGGYCVVNGNSQSCP